MNMCADTVTADQNSLSNRIKEVISYIANRVSIVTFSKISEIQGCKIDRKH